MALRWYQEEAIDSLFTYFSEYGGTDKDGKPVEANPVIALPTGTGKSLVIGGFVQRVMSMWPGQRFMALTHVKELIEQNANKLTDLWPNAPLGIYSAGLKQRDTALPIIFGGVASVVNNIEMFGWRDILMIDECHLVSPKSETMYGEVIRGLRRVNPFLKVIGLTATAFRLGQGRITDGGLFTHVCYDQTGVESFNRLIAEGYLSPLIPKRTRTELDVSSVGMNNGEFAAGQLQDAVDKQEITYAALQEACEYGYDRRSWLVFASGVEHAEHVAQMLNYMGVPAAAVHAKTKNREEVIKAFKRGELRALVNNNVLTTGFDYPPIDLIIMLRPTMSPGLWVQMLGRGTRPWAGGYLDIGNGEQVYIEGPKQNCLVLDFAGNTRRLGPINDPVIPKRKSGLPGDAPVKICEACGVYNHTSARFCVNCGTEFIFETKIDAHAATEELLRSDLPIVETFDIDRVFYHRHGKEGSPPMIKVQYYCGMRMFNEFVCLEHPGFAAKKARDWWRQRHWGEPPATTDEALRYLSELRVPRRVRVWVNKKYPEVLGYEY